MARHGDEDKEEVEGREAEGRKEMFGGYRHEVKMKRGKEKGDE